MNIFRSIRSLAALSILASAAGCASGGVPRQDFAPGTERRLVEVNGTFLAHHDEGTGEPVVLVNGGGMDMRQWEPAARELQRHGFRVIRYDPRGWGGSPPGDGPHAEHDDLAGLLDALRIPRADVVGMSWGGGVAIDAALAHPGRVRRLVLVGPAVGGYPWSRDFVARNTAWAREPNDSVRSQSLLDDAYFIPGAKSDPALMQTARALLMANAKTFRLSGANVRRLDPPAHGRLEEIRTPTLVITPERDHPDLIAIGKMLDQRVPDSRETMMPGVGHMANLERPAELARIIAEFLRGG
jgi:pimeloyl-ACP methyl ester carboxylesterase